VKISDFGVSHFFEDENDRLGPTRLLNRSDTAIMNRGSTDATHLSRMDTDSALSMKGMSHRGLLTKTEGTWCFWSPEMCGETSAPFSGYAADVWAAGVCLYIFVTGRLPFYSEVPTELFEMICEADVEYGSMEMSPSLISLLRMLLDKDPDKRAGLGDCLKHPFCGMARDERIRKYSWDVLSNKRKLVVSDEDLRSVSKLIRLLVTLRN